MDAIRPSRAGIACLLLVAALLLRAALPTGWMPAAGSDGEVRILLCTGNGAAELAPAEIAGRFKPVQQDDDPDVPHDPCPYALALAQALYASSPAIVDAVSPLAAEPEEMPVAVRIAARRSIRPPARGPPSLA